MREKKTTTLLFLDIPTNDDDSQKKMIQSGTKQSIYKRILLNAKFCGVFLNNIKVQNLRTVKFP